MPWDEFYGIFPLLWNEKHIRTSLLITTGLTLSIAVIYSPLAGFILLGSYVLGYITCCCLIKYQNNTSTYLLGVVNYFCGLHTSRVKLEHSCSICDDLSCRRHQKNKTLRPWQHLYIDSNLNKALEQFYNKILDTFVQSWYGQFTDDAEFISELRHCLRYASACVITRFLSINHSHIIATKLLPYAVKHIDDYCYVKQAMRLQNARFDDVAVSHLGKRLHAAATSRKNELLYLQHLTSELLPEILPDSYLQSKNFSILIREIVAGWVLLPLMDVLADPNMINSLVILAVTYRNKAGSRSECGERVEFLGDFVGHRGKVSPFATTLNAILSNSDLLYCFMQFLKKEDHVHLLQFCLDVDEFNNKLLSPDLQTPQLVELHSSATKLYDEYLNPNSINFINCPRDIHQDFQNLLNDGVANITKMRTSTPIYQAYEHTFNCLENTWLPLFFHSNEFYGHISGTKVSAQYNKDNVTSCESPLKRGTRKYYEVPTSQGTVAKLSSGFGKIKSALKTAQPIDGSMYTTGSQLIVSEGIEDVIISDVGNIFRDMSTWKISMTSYQISNKIVSFRIEVQRTDVVVDENSKHQWVVLRKDQDFYMLKGKLVEFHGENEICDSPLPSRRAGTSIDLRMSKYEDFLKRLLKKPCLRGSDLLYSFLTADVDFAILGSQNAQDLGNIYQSVAHKLRKEKGQHLDGFMATFLQSTGKTKHGKFEWGEPGDEIDVKSKNANKPPPLPKTQRNHIFNDNFGITLWSGLKDSYSDAFHPADVIQSIFYLLKYVFKVPYFVLKFYAAICSIAHEAVESLCTFYIQRKLHSGLSERNLTYLIQLLEGAIFHPHPSASKNDLEERRELAFKVLERLITSYLEKVLGNSCIEGARSLLEILQQPHYNKQLVYNWLDIVLVEMYPKLAKVEDT